MIIIGYIGEKEQVIKRVYEDPDAEPAPAGPVIQPEPEQEPVPA